MDMHNRKKAARVWQRVQSAHNATIAQTEPDGLIVSAQTTKGAYLKLAQHGLSENAPMLKKLSEKKQAQILCLKGIRQLTAGANYAAHGSGVPGNTPLAILRRCYGMEGNALREYEMRIADRDFGPVFGELAAEQRQLCRWLLELIGSLETIG